MQIYVDADACPVKAEVLRVADATWPHRPYGVEQLDAA